MPVSLSKLNHIAMVARTQSFSKAADKLNISQPALSRSVASIEADYGVKIFDRTYKGVELTVPGMAIVREAERLLRDAKTFDHNLQLHGQGEIGDVAVGFGPVIASILLADLGKHIFATRPNIRLTALIRPTEILLPALMNDEIEFLLGPKPVCVPDEVETQTLGRLSASFVVRKSHPLCALEEIRMQDLLQYPIASTVDVTWAMQRANAKGAFICDNFHIIRELVADSDIVWLCSQRFIAKELERGLFRIVKPTNSPLIDDPQYSEISVVLAHVKGRSVSPVAREIIAYCKSRFAAMQLIS